jgi:hypothetical protein
LISIKDAPAAILHTIDIAEAAGLARKVARHRLMICVKG